MFFFFVFGQEDFSSHLKGYENVRVQCSNCHNHSVIAMKRRRFFTLCWVPLIPTSMHEELHCTICNARSRVTKEQLDQIVASQGQPQQLQNYGNQPQPQYQQGAGGPQQPQQGYYGK